MLVVRGDAGPLLPELDSKSIGGNKSLDMSEDLNIAIIVEAWMSNNIDLLYRSVGK